MLLRHKFAKTVFYARTARGMTQEQLAAAIDGSLRTVQYIEQGAWLPKPETIFRLMIVLRISADVFSKEVKINVPVSSADREPAHT